MHISVVISTYNRAASLARTLESLRQMRVRSNLEWELIVVDNNSIDNTRAAVTEYLRTSGLNGRIVFEPKQGLCHARNRGVAEATGEIIAFTDDDVRLAPEWLEEIAETFKKFDCIGVGGKSVPEWNDVAKPAWLVTAGPHRLSSGPILEFDLGKEAKELQVPPWGLNMAFRRVAFERYGGFRTDLGVSGAGGLLGEDTEFGRRLFRLGEKIVYSPWAVVFHPVDKRRVTKSYFLRFYLRMGRTDIRADGWPVDAVLYLGIPRYMFRAFMERCTIWLFTLRSESRFCHKANLSFLIGQMMEARASHKNSPGLAGLRGTFPPTAENPLKRG
jgi:glycosyltransferase involved in cell wall biosynthesis